MADAYDSLARRLGLPIARVPAWRAQVGAPAAPSYEGATLQGMMPPAPAPIEPPAPPPPSYEGATLQSAAPAGVALAEPPRRPTGAAAAPPAFRMATGENVQTAAPASVKPSVMKQMTAVADASDATKKNVKQAVDENERKKNLEGASFHDPSQGGVQNPFGVAGGGLTLIDKGGRRPAGWQVHEGLDLGPDAQAAVDDADKSARQAAGLEYAAGMKAAEFERGYQERHAKAAETFAIDETARSEKYQTQVDEHMGKLDALRGQIREFKVDPFGGMNPGIARIGSAIAIALGAFASRRGENHGLDAVKHAIGQNILTQEKELDRLERGARGEMTFLAQLKQTYGDKRTAKEAAYIAYLERAKAELAKNLGDPSVAEPRLLAAYNRLNTQLDDELVKRLAMFKSLTQDRVIRHDVNAQPRYAGMGAHVDHRDETDAKWLAEQREKAGIPQALANLEGVDQVIDTFGDGDIPGVGPIAGKVPNILSSERAVAGRQAVAAVKNRARKAIAGSSLTDGEKAELDKELEGASDAPSLRRAVQSIRRSLHHQDANLRAGARTGGVQLYEARGGQRAVPLDKPSTPQIKEAK